MLNNATAHTVCGLVNNLPWDWNATASFFGREKLLFLNILFGKYVYPANLFSILQRCIDRENFMVAFIGVTQAATIVGYWE